MRIWALGLALGLALSCDDGTSSSSTSCADACSIAASHCLELLCGDLGCADAIDCDGDCLAVGELCRESC